MRIQVLQSSGSQTLSGCHFPDVNTKV